MNRMGLKRASFVPRLFVVALLAGILPGCGLVGPCSPDPFNLSPGNNINDNNQNDNTGNDNPGNDNNGNDNSNQSPSGCDASTCSGCDASNCLSISRAERFTNGSINILGQSTCSEDLAIDWYTTGNAYLQTFFIFGDGRSSTVGQFDAATAATLAGYRVRKNSQPQCLCNGCPLTPTP